MGRRCLGIKEEGGACQAPPLLGGDHCFWHDPTTQAEAQEARRLGELRRRREATLAGAYELDGLASVGAIRRLLEIAVTDTLSLDNSVARSRTLGYLAQIGLRTLEVGELDERIAGIEAVVLARPRLGSGRR